MVTWLPHKRHATDLDKRYPRAQLEEDVPDEDEHEDLQEMQGWLGSQSHAVDAAPKSSSQLSGRQRARGAPDVGECESQAGSSVRTDRMQGDVAADHSIGPPSGGPSKQLCHKRPFGGAGIPPAARRADGLARCTGARRGTSADPLQFKR